MEKLWQYPSSESHHSNNPIPFDIQLIILACLRIEDLFGSCLLVCKAWKDAILFSESFARLQHRQSLWGYVRSERMFHKGLVFQNGPYKVLNPMFEHEERIVFFDKGIICTSTWDDFERWEMKIRVGNPLKNNLKIIPPPSKRFLPAAMSVDTSTSPAAFKILAYKLPAFKYPPDAEDEDVLHTEIFNSTANTWSKRNPVSLNGPFQDKLGPAFVKAHFRSTKEVLLTYDFEQDILRVKGFSSPAHGRCEDIMLCKDVPILPSSRNWPCITLWKEKSCSNGIIHWDFLAELDIKIFLAQHQPDTSFKRLKGWYSYCTGDVVSVMINWFSKKMALVNYDMRKGCWELGGFMEGRNVIEIKFTPSLITV